MRSYVQHRYILFVFTILLSLLSSLVPISHTSYEVHATKGRNEISLLPTNISFPSAYNTFVQGINDSGQCVGWYEQFYGYPNWAYRGFLYNSDGTYDPNPIEYPGAVRTSAQGINDSGEIVGWYLDVRDGALCGHSFLYSDGDYTTIHDTDYATYGINDSGQMVGQYGQQYGQRGFLYNSDGTYKTIHYPGAMMSSATGINDSGEIVGWYLDKNSVVHGFLFSGGTYTKIDYPDSVRSSGSGTFPRGINDHGQIVGFYTDANSGQFGFLFGNETYTAIENAAYAVGINDSGDIVGNFYTGSGLAHSGLAHIPRLLVLIPGINDRGDIMRDGAFNIVRGDPDCTVIIREEDNWNILPIWAKQQVTDKAINAKNKGKDVIVLIDMNLENYTWEYFLPKEDKNRWFPSVAWAGGMANTVSKAFENEVPGGRRILLAHSAGGYATYESIRYADKKMYEDINILNGRVGAKDLSSALKSSGYGWQQVKVFTSKDDLPALPPIECLGSISNYDAAKIYAGTNGGWVHLHSLTITGHSGLRDSLKYETKGIFEIYRGTYGDCSADAFVKELMSWDWSTGCFER